MTFWEIMGWIYLAGTVISWPLISRVIYRHDDGLGVGKDNEDAVMAIVMGLCVCWFWPLLIPGYWIYEFVVKE